MAHAVKALRAVETRDGAVGKTRALLLSINERIDQATTSPAEPPLDMSVLQYGFEKSRARLMPLCPGYPDMAEVHDDAGRLLCVLDAFLELTNRKQLHQWAALRSKLPLGFRSDLN
jgi:hypothetical protein